MSASEVTVTTSKGCGDAAKFSENDTVKFSISVNVEATTVRLYIQEPKVLVPKEWKNVKKGQVVTFEYALKTHPIGKYEVYAEALTYGKSGNFTGVDLGPKYTSTKCSFYNLPIQKFSITTAKGCGSSVQYNLGEKLNISVKPTHDADKIEIWAGGKKIKDWTGVKKTLTYSYREFAPDKVGDWMLDLKVLFSGAQYSVSCAFKAGAGSTQPVVATKPAEGVTSSSATLKGTVTTNGLDTDASFISCGSVSDPTFFPQTPTEKITHNLPTFSKIVGYNLKGLKPATTYKYAISASNAGGQTTGACVSFTTSVTAQPPTVTTLAALSPTSSTTTLQGTVNPNGSPTKAWFESCDNSSSAAYFAPTTKQDLGDGALLKPLIQKMTGLKPNTTYRYAAVAANSLGEKKGACVSFATPPSASGSIPTIITLSATGITSIGATLNASINPNGFATQVWFTACAVPTDPAFFPNTSQRDAGSGTIVKTMTQALTGLKPNTNYSYQAWAKNSKGTKSGACVAFKTKPMSTQLSGFLKTLPQWLQRTLYIFGKKYFSPIIPNYYFLT
jgi:hypothetical protein